MCKTISRQSILKANRTIISKRARSFSSNGGEASIRCHTIYGSRTLSVPTKKIVAAAHNVMKDR